MIRCAAVLVMCGLAAGSARADGPGDEDPWKTLADVNRVAVGWQGEKTKTAYDKALATWKEVDPPFQAMAAMWQKNKELYKIRMPAGVYGDTLGAVILAGWEMTDGNTKFAAGDTFAAKASLTLDYGDLAYALGMYETANGYYESAYSIYGFAETKYNDATAHYTTCMWNTLGAVTLMMQYP